MAVVCLPAMQVQVVLPVHAVQGAAHHHPAEGVGAHHSTAHVPVLAVAVAVLAATAAVAPKAVAACLKGTDCSVASTARCGRTHRSLHAIQIPCRPAADSTKHWVCVPVLGSIQRASGWVVAAVGVEVQACAALAAADSAHSHHAWVQQVPPDTAPGQVPPAGGEPRVRVAAAAAPGVVVPVGVVHRSAVLVWVPCALGGP